MYRFLAVLHTLGFTMALFSTTMFFPMGASIIMGDGQVHIFVQSFMLSLDWVCCAGWGRCLSGES